MNRTSLSCLAIVAVFAFGPSAASAQPDGRMPAPIRTDARPAPRAAQPENPEDLYNAGMRQMKRGYYDEAILSFERVRNHFPFNQYSVLSELRVADCLYEKSSFVEAVDAYRGFARLHPRHPEIDYVVYRTARAEFKLAPTLPQRDQSHAQRGLRRLDGYEERFPDSEYVVEVRRLRGKTQLRLSRAATQIGHFYWKQDEWSAAERRYRLAVEAYPESPLVPRSMYRRGLCLWQMADAAETEADRVSLQQEARTVLGGLAVRFPDSRFKDRALAFMEGHPVEAAEVEAEPKAGEAPPTETP